MIQISGTDTVQLTLPPFYFSVVPVFHSNGLARFQTSVGCPLSLTYEASNDLFYELIPPKTFLQHSRGMGEQR